MKNNIIDLQKINALNMAIDDNTNELNEHLNKISQLIDLLIINFDEENNKNNCQNIKNIQLKKISNYCNQLETYKIVLQKFSAAYITTDDIFASEKII